MNLPPLRLLQLVSPALPVGAFSYSQGLEWAVHQGWVGDEATARGWIAGLLHHPVACFEAPLLASLMRAVGEGDWGSFARWEACYLASREGAELRAETLQMGHALLRLARELTPQVLPEALHPVTFPGVFALVAMGWGIELTEAVGGYMWSWCENQVMAAVKIIPLGQTAGQRLLHDLAGDLPALTRQAVVLPEEAWSNWAPAFALASSGHETQYCRLYRS